MQNISQDRHRYLIWVKSKRKYYEGILPPEIQFTDKTIAKSRELENLIFWPSIRLRIQFGGWRRYFNSPWQSRVVAFTKNLLNDLKIINFSWINHDVGSHSTVSILRPIPYRKSEAEKLISRTIFNNSPSGEDPIVLLRTGDKEKVYYDSGLLIEYDKIELHLSPTGENIKFLENLVEDLVKNKLLGKVSFQYADVSYGISGWKWSFTQYAKNFAKMNQPENSSPVFGSSWILWVGDLWTKTPKHLKILEILKKNPSCKVEEKNGLRRISTNMPKSYKDNKDVHAKKIKDDLNTVTKKMSNLEQKMLEPIIEKENNALMYRLKKKYGQKAGKNAARWAKKIDIKTFHPGIHKT